MPRRRALTIVESDAELERLERSAATRDIALRVSVLREIKRRPEVTIEQISAELRCGLRSVSRWLATYQKAGITGVLRPSSNTSRISPEVEREMQRLFPASDSRSIVAIQSWLQQ